MKSTYSRRGDPYRYWGVLINGSGDSKTRRSAWTPGGPRTYYNSSKYMPHVGAKQQAKARQRA